MSSIFWACTISFVLFKITSTHYYLSYAPETDLFGFKIFALLTPLLVSLIPAIFGKKLQITLITVIFIITIVYIILQLISLDDYGKTEGGWCWVVDDSTSGQIFVRYITQIINWGCIIFIIITNTVIYYQVK